MKFDFAEPSSKSAAGKKRKQVLLSESDEEEAPESASGSGSDWGADGAAVNAEDGEDEDDAVSMIDSPTDSDQANMKAGGSSSRKRKKPAATNVGVPDHAKPCDRLRLSMKLLCDALQLVCSPVKHCIV